MALTSTACSWYVLDDSIDERKDLPCKSLSDASSWTKIEQKEKISLPQTLVSNPARRAVFVELSPTALNLGDLYTVSVAPCCGAVSSFVGTTRDTFDGKEVEKLEYEVYGSMAEAKMASIAFQAMDKWRGVRRVVISHRGGEVGIGLPSVVIHVSSVHRPDGLEAVKFAIDTLKADVPIWKREFYRRRERQDDDADDNCHDEKKDIAEVSAWKANSECCGRHKQKEVK